MNIILFDDEHRVNLLPLAFTRPIADFRIGILTIKDKWAHCFDATYSYATAAYLQVKYPQVLAAQNLFINGAVLPNPALKEAIENLKENEALVHGNLTIAVNTKSANFQIENAKQINFDAEFIHLKSLSSIFSYNDQALRADYEILTAGRTSQALDANSTLVGNQLFIEPGAKVSCAIFNTETGPIYIGKDAEVLEGAIIRGPFALGEHSIVKMAAKIYGATTVGPHSKVGGEIHNAVIFGYSNKGHDGYLGNAVLGEWCNIGADSNNSNLKNNYAEVKLWHYGTKNFQKTGLQFCGLIMADHAKCGINTMFNTGTVVGVSCNIFGAGFPRNFVPDFSWGGAHGFETYGLNKAFEVAEKVFERRGMDFNQIEKDILTAVFEQTESFRKY
jgi:UDP-N-acetylglucosamine diphosphorylase/glucosamine-1-phosphate N-acetyltransferase